jgi:uncharacterized protein YjbI with pentapeptide repeats
MDDTARAALDSETPVNPYSLLDALNTAAARSQVLWLAFLGVMAYLALTVAALTHRDLLLDAGIALPLMGIRIDLAGFFTVAPAVFALVHLAVVAQFALLARKALEFDGAVRLLESTDLRSHPLRLELDSFFFAQAIAGPERARVLSAVLHGLAWATLLVLPLALLLYLQIAFLPFHGGMVTTAQRAILLVDIALLLLAGVFLIRPEASFLSAFFRLALHNPGSMAFGLAILAGAAFVSLVLAAIPGGGAHSGSMGALLSIFPRNLDVSDTDVVDSDRAAQARSVSLRGRDLRFARLDRAGLRGADLTGANLDGASLTGADLRGAGLACTAPALQGSPGRTGTGCTSGLGADFSGARLSGASLAGADLRGASFDDASLEGANLGGASLARATFARAKLQRARLPGAALQGASFASANLQGADLDGAGLELADLSGAALQGAHLTSARLGGAVLRDADLEGAVLQRAALHGADLRGARLPAADLAGAAVWQTLPPGGDAVALADMANIAIKPPGEDDLKALKSAHARVAEASATEGAPAATAPLSRAEIVQSLYQGQAAGGWEAQGDGQAWTGLLRASEAAMAEGYATRLAEHLGRLACHPRFADGAVAAGVVARAVASGFKGDPGVVADNLKSDCAAADAMPPLALQELAAAAEAGKGK